MSVQIGCVRAGKNSDRVTWWVTDMLSRGLRHVAGLMLIFFFNSSAVSAQPDCGDADTPCRSANGSYHLILPERDPVGIVMHLHGGGSTGTAMLKSDLARVSVDRGYVFVAPNGEHPEARWTKDWSVRADNTTHDRDDADFLQEVLADVRDRYQLADVPFVLAGFSRGGSMVWDMACRLPGFADAYTPVAGAFWESLPESCAGPVRLFHAHGWTDRTVPLEGRSFRDGTVVQGDVWASLKVLRETNRCGNRQPETNSFVGEFWLRHWTDCEAGQIDLLLHKGGHSAPAGWADSILDWFEGLAFQQP